MDTVDAIISRRSVRLFLDRNVEYEKIETVLKAAMYAPSAVNEQPWHFLVINDRKLFPAIMKFHPYASMLKTAPLAILVCGDLEKEVAAGNWVLDCSCASQNILLAAHSIGLGAVWAGVYPEEERMNSFSSLFRLPENVIPFALIVIGYSATVFSKQPARFKAERISLNSWGTLYE
ncbi:MAG: nitroreductase family protein [Desulfuromonadaceae bacterium]|nr:nitroreductase family protein [Desulfuromonadaceae bacterium]MDD2854717.1 nitroreductase family protein [Desulfuromonadaceae bacterium]